MLLDLCFEDILLQVDGLDVTRMSVAQVHTILRLNEEEVHTILRDLEEDEIYPLHKRCSKLERQTSDN